MHFEPADHMKESVQVQFLHLVLQRSDEEFDKAEVPQDVQGLPKKNFLKILLYHGVI